ncbi:MAG: glycosyltransferase family 2 protein [Pseudomonadota bacterium]
MNITVSVIIPAYNASSTICRAVDSALGQSGVQTEVIIVDDGSTDATRAVIRATYGQNANVQLLTTAKNSGPGAARNLAIEQASGDWLALLDADDWFAPKRLETLINAAIFNGFDFIADSYYLSRDNETIPYAARFTDITRPDRVTGFDAASFVRHGMGSVKPVIRKQFLDKHKIRFDPAIWRAEDLLLFGTLLMHGAKFGLLNTPLYYRSVTPGSLSKIDKIKLHADLQQVLKKLLQQTSDLGPEHPLPDAISYRIGMSKDAMAAARWEGWLKRLNGYRKPNLISLFKAFRHLILRDLRYHIYRLP